MKLVFVITCFLLPLTANADDLNSSPQDKLVGTWVVPADEDNRSALTFNADGTFELVATDPEAPQRVIGQASGTYKVDFTVSPAHLDLDARIRKPKHEEPVKRTFEMIIQMIDTNRFRISSVGLPERPKAFGKQSHVMQRQLTPPADADK